MGRIEACSRRYPSRRDETGCKTIFARPAHCSSGPSRECQWRPAGLTARARGARPLQTNYWSPGAWPAWPLRTRGRVRQRPDGQRR